MTATTVVGRGRDGLDRRRILRVGAVVWAAVGLGVATRGWPDVNPDARLLVGAATVLGPGAALGAAALLRSPGRERLAGLLLAVSAVLTPTWFGYPVAVPALVAGVTLLARPGAVAGRRPRTAAV